MLAYDTPLAVFAAKDVVAGASAALPVLHGAEDAFSFLAPSSAARQTQAQTQGGKPGSHGNEGAR